MNRAIEADLPEREIDRLPGAARPAPSVPHRRGPRRGPPEGPMRLPTAVTPRPAEPVPQSPPRVRELVSLCPEACAAPAAPRVHSSPRVAGPHASFRRSAAWVAPRRRTLGRAAERPAPGARRPQWSTPPRSPGSVTFVDAPLHWRGTRMKRIAQLAIGALAIAASATAAAARIKDVEPRSVRPQRSSRSQRGKPPATPGQRRRDRRFWSAAPAGARRRRATVRRRGYSWRDRR